MKMFFLVLILFFSIQSNAQVWIDNNATWYYDWSSIGFGGFEEISYTQDTLIDGVLCQKIEAAQHEFYPAADGEINYLGVQNYLAGITYVHGDTVFYRNNNEFFTLFNFGAQVDDIWVISTTNPNDFSLCNDTSKVKVTQVGIVTINSINYRTLTLESISGSPYKLEGEFVERFGSIGSSSGKAFFPISYGCDSSVFYDLYIFNFKCFEDDSFNLYNPSGSICYYVSNIVNPKLDKFSVYPNPSTDLLYIDINSSNIKQIEIYSMYGEVVFSSRKINYNQIIFNISELVSGQYFVKIGETYSKFIKL